MSPDLAKALAASDRPEVLKALIDTARRTLGHFDEYYPFTFMYPWVVTQLEHLPLGSRVLDLGAGVSPLPIFLAEAGMLLDCVDNGPIVTSLPSTKDWTSWGFFDYAAIHRGIRAHHCDVAEFVAPNCFEAAYSVGSLAHLSRQSRRRTLLSTRKALLPLGIFLLTLGLIPSSDFIWNRFCDREVESPPQHGTVDDVLRELEILGFRVKQYEIIRTVYKSRTDYLLVSCSREDTLSDSNDASNLSFL